MAPNERRQDLCIFFWSKRRILMLYVCSLFFVWKFNQLCPVACPPVYQHANALRTAPLARQKKSQITRYFTTQMLHYQKLKSDSEEHLEQVRVFHLHSLYAVLKGQSQSVGARFYTEAYFSLFLSFERALSITCSVKPICSKTPPRYGMNIRTWISQHLFRTEYQHCFFVFTYIPAEFKIS